MRHFSIAAVLSLKSQLALREDSVEVTLSPSQRSVDFFKRADAKQKVPYQRMIRALVDGLCGEAGAK